MRLSRQRFVRSRAARFTLERFADRTRHLWPPLGFARALACLIGIFRTPAGALGGLAAFRRRQIDAGAPRFRQTDGDGLFGGERAPCSPRRILSISPRTNSPACVEADLPSRLSRRAFSIVRLSGMSSSTRIKTQTKTPPVRHGSKPQVQGASDSAAVRIFGRGRRIVRRDVAENKSQSCVMRSA